MPSKRVVTSDDQGLPLIDKFYSQMIDVFKEIEKIDAEGLTEADTRAKIIDKIFIVGLGWSEDNIVREDPILDGYSDYTLRFESRVCLHIEAKRASVLMELPDKHYRHLKINGAYLLGNGSNKLMLKQLVGYTSGLGSDVGVLTNGKQWMVIRAFISGKRWDDYNALVFYSLSDILENFDKFYGALSYESVTQGGHYRQITDLGTSFFQMWKPREFTPNHSQDLYRNAYWNKIKQVFDHIFVDQPDNESLQLDIIKNCYVFNRTTMETDTHLKDLLIDSIPRSINNMGVDRLHENIAGGSKLIDQILGAARGSTSETYILTGGVGSGKTTYLRRFSSLQAEAFVRDNCLWFHLDFLGLGPYGSEDDLQDHLLQYTFGLIRATLEKKYADLLPKNGTQIRELFSEEIEKERMIRLYKIERDSEKENDIINQIVSDHTSSSLNYVDAIFKKAKKLGKAIVIVFDNTDQLGEDFQEKMFLFAKAISSRYKTINVVALREEKFFVAHKKGIFDAFGDRSFHIGSPNINSVISRRFRYGLLILRDKIKDIAKGPTRDEYETIYTYIDGIYISITRKNYNIVRLVECLAGGNTRFALKLFKDFLSSGNTNISKIIHKLNDGGYSLPFHEFAKSIILGHKRYYSSTESNVINVFSRSQSHGAMRLTKMLIVKILYDHRNNQDPNGVGFVKISDLINEFSQAFNEYTDLLESIEQLAASGLIETEPPKEKKASEMVCVRLSASGVYYHRYLVRAFAYLDLIWFDTPFDSIDKAKRLSKMADSILIPERIQRVRFFIDDLKQEEVMLTEKSKRNGATFKFGIMEDISMQIEKEIAEIIKKNGILPDQVLANLLIE